MSKPSDPQSVARSITGAVLRRRFAALGASIVAIAVVGLLTLWGLGFLGSGKEGCGPAMPKAEAHPACCEHKPPSGSP